MAHTTRFSLCGFSIDAFGNRTGEVYSGNSTAPMTAPVEWVNYDANNRMTNSSQVMGGYAYDAAGDVTNDGVNTYTYDAEGRVSTACAYLTCTKYVYDAEGRRVAKGSYDPQSGAFAATEQYILGLGGEEVTALNGDGQWLRTNAYLGGALLATYKDAALYFQFTDWLGTKRVQLANDGTQPETCRSLPYGNQLDCSGGPEVDPHHFTGKQRDSETGLDYFGARYYSSNLGRWTIPDWSAKAEPVPYAKLDDPQSLNLYGYVRNNPLSKTDPDGHETEAEKQAKIRAAAAAQNGSHGYDIKNTNISNMQIFKRGSDKCNEFVSDTVTKATGVPPTVVGTDKIPTASQFADPNVKITGLSAPEPMSKAKPGDVLAQDHGPNAKTGNEEGHVGIIVALPHDGKPGQTASANANQGGQVTVNDWGFRSPIANPNNGERNGASSPAPVVRHPLGDQQ